MPYVWNGTTYTIAGTYTYTTTNAKGCDSTAILNLTVGAPVSPQLFVQDSTQVCAASYVVSAGAGYNSYLWSTGAVTSSVSVTTSKWYRCTVTTAGCSATDSIYVLITNPATIGFLRNVLAINTGLDFVYILVGLILLTRAKPVLKGFGFAILLQGLFLLIFDVIFLFLCYRS
jgi:hypothetical protein